MPKTLAVFIFLHGWESMKNTCLGVHKKTREADEEEYADTYGDCVSHLNEIRRAA
jgi:hypothetical protein